MRSSISRPTLGWTLNDLPRVPWLGRGPDNISPAGSFIEFHFNGEPYAGSVFRLNDATNSPLATGLIFQSTRQREELLSRLQRALFIVGLGVIGFALIVSLVFANGLSLASSTSWSRWQSGWRSTYFNQSPLIGVPMLWHWKTPMPIDGRVDNDVLLQRKADGARTLPPAYDACWDTGFSLHFDRGWLESAIALTQGTLSNPKAAANDSYQGIVTVGLKPMPGLRFGGSTAAGAWIYPTEVTESNDIYNKRSTSVSPAPREIASNPKSSYPEASESYLATVYGGYLEYSFSYWQFFSGLAWEQ
ncbi:MAG: hypothetical protein V2A56_11320 [bacterium]